jgi:hypothetical protein
MTHAEFVAAYEAGRIRVSVNRDAASRFVAGHSMLPLVLLPVLGLGVALALVGYVIAGTLVFLAALLLRFVVRRSSGGFILWRALQDAEFYRQATAERVLSIDQHKSGSEPD